MIRALAPMLAASMIFPSPTHADTQTYKRPFTQAQIRVSAVCASSPKGHYIARTTSVDFALDVCVCFAKAFTIPIITNEYLRAPTDRARERVEDRLLLACIAETNEFKQSLPE